MRFHITDEVRGVHFPPISEVKKWVAEYRGRLSLIDLCQAVPDYPPAPELTDHLAGLLGDPQTARYSPDEGLPEVREAVCSRYRRVYGAVMKPENLCLTIGASQAFWLAVITLCRPGDEVVVQVPYYFDHAMALDMLGIRSVYSPFSQELRGVPSVEAIARLITPRTKAILLVSPSNPTGAVTPPETLHQLALLARRHGIALLVDETYSDFIAGGARPHELFTDPSWGDCLVHIASFGKTYALTGYRAGLLAASAEFIHHALKVQDTMAVCQPRITQQAVKFGVERLDGWVAANRLMMERRHNCFCEQFARDGNPFVLAASGAFFAWIRHPWPELTGREAARRLLDDAGLLTLPGEVFGPGLHVYLRLAFGNIAEEAIPEAVQRFRSFVSDSAPFRAGA